MITDWEELLQSACLSGRAPGAVLGVSEAGERSLAAYGVTSLAAPAAVTTQTIFRMGSMAKLLTSLLCLRDAETGRLDLDAPIRATMPALRLADLAAQQACTPHHLLTHTGGLCGDVLDGPSEGEDALAAYVAAGARLLQVTAPGEAFSYCNAGFPILARVSEHLSGTSCARRIRSEILDPLDMRRTGVHLKDAPTEGRSESHVFNDAGTVCHLVENPPAHLALSPAGAQPWTTAGDVLTMGEALLRGGEPILTEASLAAMHAVHVAGPTPTFAPFWGLGSQIFSLSPLIWGHDGAVAGQWSFLRIAPAQKLVICLFLNGGDARAIFHDIVAGLENELARPLRALAHAFPQKGARPPERAHCGRFAIGDQGLVITSEGEDLIARPLSPPGAAQIRIRAQPDAEQDLYLCELPFSRLATQLRFRLGAEGQRYVWFRGRLFPEERTA